MLRVSSHGLQGSGRPRVQHGHIVGEVGGVPGDDGEVVLEGGGSEEFLN